MLCCGGMWVIVDLSEAEGCGMVWCGGLGSWLDV